MMMEKKKKSEHDDMDIESTKKRVNIGRMSIQSTTQSVSINPNQSQSTASDVISILMTAEIEIYMA